MQKLHKYRSSMAAQGDRNAAQKDERPWEMTRYRVISQEEELQPLLSASVHVHAVE